MSKKVVRIAITAALTIVAICLAVLWFTPSGWELAAELSKGLAGVAVSIVILAVAEQSNQHAREAYAESQNARADAERARRESELARLQANDPPGAERPQ